MCVALDLCSIWVVVRCRRQTLDDRCASNCSDAEGHNEVPAVFGVERRHRILSTAHKDNILWRCLLDHRGPHSALIVLGRVVVLVTL